MPCKTSLLKRLLCLFFVVLLASPLAHAFVSQAAPSQLSVDGRSDKPLGIPAGTPRFAWVLDAGDAKARGVRQESFEIRVATTAADLAHPDLWDSSQIRTRDLFAVYAGKQLPGAASVYWQIRTWQSSLAAPSSVPSAWSSPASFTTAPKSWDAPWIAASPVSSDALNPRPLPLFRYSFVLKGTPVRALLMVSGLGQNETHINGRNVTQDVLTPGWTDYSKRVFYDTYEVLALLDAKGPNAIGIMLGNSMYNSIETPGRYTKFTAPGRQPKFTLQLLVTYADGSVQTIATDTLWKTRPGPITFSSVYGGEDFDARLEPAGWDLPGFDDSEWRGASAVDGPGGQLVPEQAPPIRAFDSYKPVKITHPRAGLTVYDLGQNFAGWPQISATGPAGTTIKLIAGELLDAHGLVSQESDNVFPDAPNLFTFTLRGTGKSESWHPRFSYWGFRYVQAEVLNQSATIDTLQGDFLHAAAPVIGHFSAAIPAATSTNLLDRIHLLIDRAILSNMVSIFTDCPTREKLGWLEETQLAATSIMSNYDVSLLYRKVEDDMQDAQLSASAGKYSGLVPTLAPEFVQFNDAASGEPGVFRDTPEWGSAVILSPWAAYQAYGDVTPLRSHYASMQRYVDYLRGRRAQNPDHILAYGLGDWYDIGPGEPGLSKNTTLGVTATVTFYQDLLAMAHIAGLLGVDQDATHYTQEAAEVRAAFNAKFFHPETNQYDRGSQTANAMPLALGMVPDGHQAAVLANLVANIEAHGYHVTSGEVGFHYLVRALTENHRSDILFKMFSLTTSPSYGYQLAQGATTLTEAWDTYAKSSQNHFMLGTGEEWFYRGLAGVQIDLSRAAPEQIRISPYIPDTATGSASASIATPVGTVATAWKHAGDALTVEVTIPPNAKATLTFPADFQSQLTESGKTVEHALGVEVEALPGTFILSSGRYVFQARSK